MAEDKEAAKSVASRSLFNPEGTVASQQSMLAARVDYVCEQQIYYTKKIEGEKRRLADTEKVSCTWASLLPYFPKFNKIIIIPTCNSLHST